MTFETFDWSGGRDYKVYISDMEEYVCFNLIGPDREDHIHVSRKAFLDFAKLLDNSGEHNV